MDSLQSQATAASSSMSEFSLNGELQRDKN